MEVRLVSARDFSRAEWLDLWAAGRNSSPFAHPVWQESYSEVARTNLQVAVGYVGRDLAALLPLERRPLGWRSAACAVSDHGEPLLQVSADRAEFLRGVAEACGNRLTLHGLTMEHSGSLAVAQGRLLRIPSGGDWAKALPAGYRRDHRAMLRKGMELSIWQGPNAVQALGRMATLHESRWRKRGLPGGFRGWRGDFHRRFLGQGGPSAILEANLRGQTVGAIYLLKGPSVWAYYQAGIRPQSGISPGTFLIAEAVRLASESGMTRLDFLRGTEAYKSRWAPEGAYSLHQWRSRAQWLSRAVRGLESLKSKAENFG